MCCLLKLGAVVLGACNNYVKEIESRPDRSGRHHRFEPLFDVTSSKIKLNMPHAIATKMAQEIRSCLIDYSYCTEGEAQFAQLSHYLYCLQVR